MVSMLEKHKQKIQLSNKNVKKSMNLFTKQ